MSWLIIPDIHEKLGRLTLIMKRYKGFKKIFLGDWYDSWTFHSADYIAELARYHAEFVEDPDNVCIDGNHDIQYQFPKCEPLTCTGWSQWKQQPIDTHMKASWPKVKLHHWIETEDKQSWLISHAGFHPNFAHPVYGMSQEYVDKMASNALGQVRYENYANELLRPGATRGGHEGFIGGCTWMDWTKLQPIDGINQVVGHSYNRHVRTKHTETSKNWCLDTGLKHLMILEEDGSSRIEFIYNLDSGYRS